MNKEYIKFGRIYDIEIKTFLQSAKKYTTLFDDSVKIDDKLTFIQDILKGFLSNRNNTIVYGVDKMLGFEIHLAKVSDEQIQKILQNIWDNPDSYYFSPNSDYNCYYDFLKFLWVGEERLGDLIKT
ncbi:MAG: hypothetical protein WC827_03750 [Candidatus Paceibacterota bacterium]|jgi:hypothetical protein